MTTRKLKGTGMVVGVAIMVLLFSGCWKKDKNEVTDRTNLVAWEFEKTIPEKIKGISGEKDSLLLGDLEQNKVSFSVPEGAFDDNTEVVLANPEKVPEYDGNIMEPLGSPIDISAGDNKRMNEKARVTFKFDPAGLPSGEEVYQIRVAYYDGEKWEYVKSQKIDKEKGEITFDTYHFSLLGPVKVKDETKITEDWIHSQAVDSVLRDQINNEVDNVAGQIADMIMEKMGVNDEATRSKVLGEVLNADGYKEIYDEYKKGDINSANEKLALLAGQKIAENVPESVFSKALGEVVGSAEDIAAVSKAAGYAAEGQYKEAAKIIGEKIADKFLITTAGKIAVEMVDYQIQSWKNSEVEAAYEAYKKGADGVFWGYNVDPGDFDGVWDQMRGIRRQLELEAIKKENGYREEAGMLELTERQAELMRTSLKEKYRKQFAERVKKDEEIKKAEDQLRILMSAFKKKDLFSDSLGPAGLDKGYEFEQKLELLNHFAQKMMKDTKRSEVLDKETTLKEGAITADSIALGARIYFSEPDGKKKYKEYLASNFGINPYPELKNLAGNWSGTATITDVYISDELKNEMANKNSDEGECDLDINLEDLIGKANPFGMNLAPSSDKGGVIKTGEDGDYDNTFTFTYENGTITAPLEQEGATGTMVLDISGEEGNYIADGSAVISYAEGKAKLTMTISVKKGN